MTFAEVKCGHGLSEGDGNAAADAQGEEGVPRAEQSVHMNVVMGKRVIRAAVVVAHPDDETLWSGGTILKHPKWKWHVATLCRGADADRAPRFREALKALKAEGMIGDLDDGPGQEPLSQELVCASVLALLPKKEKFDLVLTHDPGGEYTRHRRHEEAGAAVIRLWNEGAISTRHLWTFAYADDGRGRLPKAASDADFSYKLPLGIWRRKHSIITEIYGFAKGSFEARATPKREGFRCFDSPVDAQMYLTMSGGQR